jgi:hypothetical protein
VNNIWDPSYSTKHLFPSLFPFFSCDGATTEKFPPLFGPRKKLLSAAASSKHDFHGSCATTELVRPNVQSDNNAMEVGGGMGGTCTDTFFEYSLVSLELGLRDDAQPDLVSES